MPKAVAKAPKKAANGYKMPDPLPKGLVLTDVFKKKWKLGSSIGKGGFGEIYEAQQEASGGTKYPYVVKIEPHQNGPLFVEMHFYVRVAKSADIEEYRKSKKLATLGMPPYIGSGSHDYNGEKYRFLVLEKYSSNDIWKLFLQNNKCFPEPTVFKLGLQILDVLEYIHSKGYVHADIKGANILLGTSKETSNQAYLVDFGLACHYSTAKQFTPDPKKAHDGTIEYLSRDAHQGVQTRRGDLEILLYNLIQWLGCTLPWENCLKNPVSVKESKEKHMKKSSDLIKACFVKKSPPKAILEYIKYLETLKFDTEPDYAKVRKILLSGLETGGGTLNSPLNFKTTATPAKRKSVGATASPEKKRKLSPKKPVNGTAESEPKKRGRKLKVTEEKVSDQEEEEDNLPAPNVVKKRGKKPVPKRDVDKKEKDEDKKENDEDKKENDEVDEDDESCVTAEMKRIRSNITTRTKLVVKNVKSKNEEQEEDSDSGQSTVSETAEMQRIRTNISLKKNVKKPVKKRAQAATNGLSTKVTTATNRTRRQVAVINYSENTPPTKQE